MGPDNLSAFLIKTFAFACWASAFSAGQRLSVPEPWKKIYHNPIAPKKHAPHGQWLSARGSLRQCFETTGGTLIRCDTHGMEVKLPLDHFQVAYVKKKKENCSASDAISMLISKLLESLAAYARLLFIDFSSAWNSIQPHILLEKKNKLVELDVNAITPSSPPGHLVKFNIVLWAPIADQFTLLPYLVH